MFDRELWRRTISERLSAFARNPRQEIQLSGAPNLFSYLAAQVLAPFLEAFQDTPIDAVLAFSAISKQRGANLLVKRAIRRSYQSAAQLDREMRSNQEIRSTIERLLVELHVVMLARQRLSGSRDEWFRMTLEGDLETYPGEFQALRRILSDPAGQARLDALRRLKIREGHYTPADLLLLHDSLRDSAASVRATAVRLLGMIAEPPPDLLVKTLLEMALHDCDAQTRYASARAIGMLREQVASPEVLDYLSASLFDDDRFYRASAALVLGQLGEMAGSPILIRNLTMLLHDSDAYAREAAARALGKIGASAATPNVMTALSHATQDSEIQVHEAATDALITLREYVREPEIELAVA